MPKATPRIRADTTPLDPRAFARTFGVSLRHLAEYANAAPETPLLRPQDARLQRFMREMHTVLARATELGGGQAAGLDWLLHLPLGRFGYRTAEEMIAEGRCNEVLQYLDGVTRWDAVTPPPTSAAVFAAPTQACK